MIIESKAPTRVDFAGGTLDIWPLYLFHPSAVTVNAAISLYASCVIETNDPDDSRIKLVSRDIKREESFASFAALVKVKRYRLPLLAEITKFFHPQGGFTLRSEEHTSELQSRSDLVCRLLLEKKKSEHVIDPQISTRTE